MLKLKKALISSIIFFLTYCTNPKEIFLLCSLNSMIEAVSIVIAIEATEGDIKNIEDEYQECECTKETPWCCEDGVFKC